MTQDKYPVSKDTFDRATPAERQHLVVREGGLFTEDFGSSFCQKCQCYHAVGKHVKSEPPSGTQRGNKYGAVRTWSELCRRTFDSKAEARRGEELFLMEKAGEIHNLSYQVPFPLCENPKITVTLDFVYHTDDDWDGFVYEDVKGVLTRDSRTKYAWLREKFGVEVRLIK